MFNVEIDLAGLDARIAPLKPGGEVQVFIDTEFIKHCDPYVPRDTGMLADSAWLSTDIGSGQIVYNTPYAEKVYKSPELNFQGAPMRGAFWATRMWADRGDQIMDGAAIIAGGRSE
jgi:hypothetical protein